MARDQVAFPAAAERLNAKYKCLISLVDDASFQQPRGEDAVTVGVKDCIDVEGARCTWGSALPDTRIPDRDARVVELLKAAGGAIVATTNLHEFAFGGTNRNPHHGDCRNAWAPDFVSGGSSGGSAVGVALGLCRLGIGTDTGASVRMPASLNGVVGLRPTHGAVSNAGVMPVSPPHDTVGFFARDIETIRWALRATVRFDGRDPFSRRRPVPAAGKRDAFRLGLPTALLEDTDPDIARAFEDALRILETKGHAIHDVRSTKFEEVARHLAAIIIADAASFHEERLTRTPEAIGATVHQRIASGLTMRAVDYARELRWVESFRGEVLTLFQDGTDAFVYPSVPASPPKIDDASDATEQTARLSANCWAAPACRSPAVSVPCGLDRAGVPIGLQFMGHEWSEPSLLTLAESFLSSAGDIGHPADYVRCNDETHG